MKLRVAFGLSMAALVACSGEPEACARLSPAGPRWCLLAPRTAPSFTQIAQLRLLTAQGTDTLLVQVENDAHGLRAAVLTPLGQRLALVQFDGEKLTREVLGQGAPFDSAALLALVQLTRWPMEVLVPALRPSGLELGLEIDARVLRGTDGAVVARVTCTTNDCLIELPQLGMEMALRDLPHAGEAQ